MAKRICPDCGEEWDDEDPHYLLGMAKAEIARLNRIIAVSDQVVTSQNKMIAAMQDQIAAMRDQLAILQKLQSVEGQRELAAQAEATLKEHGLYEQVVEALKDKRKS